MYEDSAGCHAMPSPPTPNLVVAEKNTLEFREQRTKYETQVMKAKMLSRAQSPSKNSIPGVERT